MPTNQPTSAPDTAPTPNDQETAAKVIHDDALDTPPGGGGLGGVSAADALGGSARTPLGTSPNAPIDTSVSAGTDEQAEAESRVEASQADPAEPHPSSR